MKPSAAILFPFYCILFNLENFFVLCFYPFLDHEWFRLCKFSHLVYLIDVWILNLYLNPNVFLTYSCIPNVLCYNDHLSCRWKSNVQINWYFAKSHVTTSSIDTLFTLVFQRLLMPGFCFCFVRDLRRCCF